MDFINDILKPRIELPDLASNLGITLTQNGKGYLCSIREESSPSCSIYYKGEWLFNDFGSSIGGDSIHFYRVVKGSINVPLNFRIAIEQLAEQYGVLAELKKSDIEFAKANNPQPIHRDSNTDEKEMATNTPRATNSEYLWGLAKKHTQIALAAKYLVEKRGLPSKIVETLIGRSIGFTNYVPDGGNSKEWGNGVVFPVISPDDGRVRAISTRYIDPDHTQPKSRQLDSPSGNFYCPNWPQTKKAKIVFTAEAPIDILSIWAAFGGENIGAVAFLSTSYVEHFQLNWLQSHQILVIWGDRDGPGIQAARRLYQRAISANKLAFIVEGTQDLKSSLPKDANEYLKVFDLEKVRKKASTYDESVFPGGAPFISGKPELQKMANFRCYEDSTAFVVIKKLKTGMADEDGNPETILVEELHPVIGARILRVFQANIFDPRKAMGTQRVSQPDKKIIVVFRQTGSDTIQTKILEDIGEYRLWNKIGIVHHKPMTGILLQLLSADKQFTKSVVNVIGLVWNGKGELVLNDSTNTFPDPKTTVYHNLIFPDTSPDCAKTVIKHMSVMLKDYKALMLLVWVLGSFLKVFLGFWPHLSMPAKLESGKTTLKDIIKDLTGCHSFEHTALHTDYQRMLTVGQLFPAIIDECSRAKPEALDAYVDLLSNSYTFETRRRGTDRTHIVASPICFVGQDWQAKDAAFSSKMLFIDMENSQGTLPPDDLVAFPVKSWGEWIISTQSKEKVKAIFAKHQTRLLEIAPGDDNLQRFTGNYSALCTAWSLLAEWSHVEDLYMPVIEQITNFYEVHAVETLTIRKEGFVILKALADYISSEDIRYLPPYLVEGKYLYIATQTIIKYLSKKMNLVVRDAKRINAHLKNDGFLLKAGINKTVGRGDNKRRVRCVELSLVNMAQFGIDWPIFPDEHSDIEIIDEGNIVVPDGLYDKIWDKYIAPYIIPNTKDPDKRYGMGGKITSNHVRDRLSIEHRIVKAVFRSVGTLDNMKIKEGKLGLTLIFFKLEGNDWVDHTLPKPKSQN